MHELHEHRINNTLEQDEQCLQMQTVPKAQLRHPQQEKNFFCLFSPFYFLFGFAVLFSMALARELIKRQKEILFEKKACETKEKGLA